MELKSFLIVFTSIFLAEMGDKTQLATFLFSSGGKASPWVVFLGSSLALITVAGISVIAGKLVSEYVNVKYLNYFAGVLFIGIGFWTIVKG